NSAQGNGGGLYAHNTLNLTGTQFVNNNGGDAGGGALVLEGAQIDSGQFANNFCRGAHSTQLASSAWPAWWLMTRTCSFTRIRRRLALSPAPWSTRRAIRTSRTRHRTTITWARGRRRSTRRLNSRLTR